MTPAAIRRTAASLICALALALCAGTTAAQAQGVGLPNQANGKPVEITAVNGIEWQQNAKKYIARGDARAAQGDVTVFADVLTAHYRDASGGSTSIWRIDADDNVKIVTPTQTAYGDKGVYDVENGILVLTGSPRLDTQTDRITARDSLEYWEKRSLAVARGNAIATRGENKLRADVLTAHFVKDKQGQSKVKQVDAFDNVVITSPDEIVLADRGVYDVETGIATVTGSVKITRGDNQLNGEYAEVDLNTGVSRLFGRGNERVQGIFTPEKPPPAQGGKTGGTGSGGTTTQGVQ